MKKAKAKLKELTSRSQGRNVRVVMQKVKVYIRGWLGYFGIASMKTTMREWDKWLRRRYRSYIWKQWKKPKTRAKSLMQLGDTRVAGKGGKQLPESLLAHGEERSCTKGNLERKTRTGRILQYPRPVRVCALMRLNRRVPNGTHGGVRGRD